MEGHAHPVLSARKDPQKRCEPAGGRPDGFALHGPVLARMKAEGYSQGKMSRETGLAINTVKGYLKRLEGQRDA